MRTNDRMRRLLALARKEARLTTLLARLKHSKNEIRAALLEVPDRPSLGTNLAKGALTSIDTARKALRRERGNVARALASSRRRAS